VVARHLLDVNVLLALAWPAHVHHGEAHAWFQKHRQSGFATCPLTQLGFVRISSNTKFTKEAVTPNTAFLLLERITALREHVFWPDALSCKKAFENAPLFAGHRQLTDLYLIGLARGNGGMFATFDRSVPMSGTFGESVVIISNNN
jgi:hypothetical protein